METCSKRTRAAAWLEAADMLLRARKQVYNLVVEITEPGYPCAEAAEIESRVDEFLRQHDCQPIQTVADTIFPTTEYMQGGLAKLYEYPRTIYPHIKANAGNAKGTYALRLVERRCADNSTMNPLKLAVAKLKQQLKSRSPQRAIYELDLTLEPLELKFYESEIDYNNPRGGQCLSHVSLKLGPGPDRVLYMTAMYRYQYFVQKALGNFKGLARLQACIAREVGISPGPLVCHATLAVLEEGKGGSNGERPWGRPALERLLKECRQIQADAKLARTA